MTTQTKSRTSFPIAYLILGALVLFALAIGVYRLVVGLGPTTNLDDFYPWGLWITFDVFAVPFSAGAFTLAALVHIFHRERYHGIARLAVLAGFLGYLLVVLVLLMDLGRWDQFYSVLIPTRWNLHSFMFEVSMSITIYFGVLVLELLETIFSKREGPVIRLVHNLIPLIAGVGVLLSTVHQGSLGALFLMLDHRLHPLWWTPILPLLFLNTAIISGLAVASFLAIVTWRALGEPSPVRILRGLAKIAAYALGIYLVLKLGDLLFAGEIGLLFTSGWLSLLFWLELLVGVVAPLFIFATSARRSENWLLGGVVAVLVGLLLNRAAIAWFGLAPPVEGVSYAPSWMEWAILVGAVAFGVLVYALGIRYLAPLRETVKEGHHA
jgi:Ni/Fe-hydrogenase subunit HybB-like protein